jgi:hypothetical protein
VLSAVQDDRVQCPVELAVAAAADPVPDGLAAGGGDGGDAGEAGKAGLGAQATAVRPGNEQLRGDDRADARLVEQRRREPTHVGEDLVLELLGLDRCGLDPTGEAAQDEPSRELVPASRLGAAQPAAALE